MGRTERMDIAGGAFDRGMGRSSQHLLNRQRQAEWEDIGNIERNNLAEAWAAQNQWRQAQLQADLERQRLAQQADIERQRLQWERDRQENDLAAQARQGALDRASDERRAQLSGADGGSTRMLSSTTRNRMARGGVSAAGGAGNSIANAMAQAGPGQAQSQAPSDSLAAALGMGGLVNDLRGMTSGGWNSYVNRGRTSGGRGYWDPVLGLYQNAG